MATKQKSYGWTYNKSGKRVQVSAPETVSQVLLPEYLGIGQFTNRIVNKFTPIPRKRKTHTGGLLGGVGFGGVIGSNIRNNE